MEGIIHELAQDKGIEVLGLEIHPDHNHLWMSSPPKNSPALVIQWFKGISARLSTHRFKDRLQWTRSSYAAGTVTAETIHKYSEAQSTA